MQKIPQLLKAFRVYKDDGRLVGIVDLTLPDIEYLSETVKGSGISGEIEAVIAGHVKAMEMTLKWQSLHKDVLSVAGPYSWSFDIRGVIQAKRTDDSNVDQIEVKIMVKGTPKKTGLGKFESAKSTDSETVLSVSYLNLSLDGASMMEVDPLNFICVIDGVDYLSGDRAALGME
jgi:P2 family phage contractile tail tube protein